MWDFVMDNCGAGEVFLRVLRFVSPANLHSICFSIITFTITPGWHNRPGVASRSRIKKKKKDLTTQWLNTWLAFVPVLYILWFIFQRYQYIDYMLVFSDVRMINESTRYPSWLRHYATSRKVAGSIPDEVTEFFNWPNPSSGTMALGSTQPITEMITRSLPGR
jgi:branched-subunit amino acid transport protein